MYNLNQQLVVTGEIVIENNFNRCIFRQCGEADLPEILKIRKNFEVGNGGLLKYSRPEKINLLELYGLFLGDVLIGITKIHIDDFYYYQPFDGFLKLNYVHDCACRSSTFLLPHFRKSYGKMFLSLVYKQTEKFGKSIVSELRGIYQNNRSVFWKAVLDQYLGAMTYQEYLLAIEEKGELNIVQKLPTVLKTKAKLGGFHHGSKVMKIMNIRRGYKFIGYSYSTGSPIFLKYSDIP